MCPSLLSSDPTEAIDLAGVPVLAELVPFTASDARTLATAFAGMLPWSRYPFSAAQLEAYLGAHEVGSPRYCLHIGEEPAGALGLRLNWLRGPYIQFLGVTPSFQKTGLGAAILTRVLAEARTRGDRNVWVAASSFNADALRFYERHGFQRAATIDGLIEDGIDEVLLRTRL